MKPKLLVILGPTASGKSDLAVKLAREYNGEVISADSRQVYRGLDIGTGKITTTEMQGVPHHLLDVADPHDRFTAIDWKTLAEKSIADITSRGKLPIICGGTGFYISTLIDDLGFPDIEIDAQTQKDLEARSAEELFEELKSIDPARASTIDPWNKRRLARAILIARELGAVPPVTHPSESKYNALMIGIKPDNTELRLKIEKRLVARLDAGMIDEAQRLNSPKGANLSFERMEELGLEYRYLARYLKNELTRQELIDQLATKIWQYARRQMTWFRKDSRIQWFAPDDFEKIQDRVTDFLE